MKEKNLAQAKKIEKLQARLVMELATAKSKAETDKVDTVAIVSVYRFDAEAAQDQAKKVVDAAQVRAYWVAEHLKC